MDINRFNPSHVQAASGAGFIKLQHIGNSPLIMDTQRRKVRNHIIGPDILKESEAVRINRETIFKEKLFNLLFVCPNVIPVLNYVPWCIVLRADCVQPCAKIESVLVNNRRPVFHKR